MIDDQGDQTGVSQTLEVAQTEDGSLAGILGSDFLLELRLDL